MPSQDVSNLTPFSVVDVVVVVVGVVVDVAGVGVVVVVVVGGHAPQHCTRIS